jgi:hypothetical protein
MHVVQLRAYDQVRVVGVDEIHQPRRQRRLCCEQVVVRGKRCRRVPHEQLEPPCHSGLLQLAQAPGVIGRAPQATGDDHDPRTGIDQPQQRARRP